MAKLAIDNRYCRPKLSKDDIIEIIDGRHPLAEKQMDVFVPNSTQLSNQTGKVHLLTGPNFSGKSIYLKQVGLITFMAHLGSFVPATSAIIGVVDFIGTRIRSFDSQSVTESSFILDSQQVAGMLKAATSKSLLLFDEYGKGTNTIDGASLMGGILRYFSNSNSASPKVIATSHFAELITGSHVPESNILKMFRMDVHSASNSESFNNTSLTYLYRMVPGHCIDSFSFHCALYSGLALEIVERAKTVADSFRSNKLIKPIGKTDAFCVKVCKDLLSLNLNDCDIMEFIKKASELAKRRFT
ncbi:hypothetical protein GEMRC1_008731 [Eukaryota sp. GEM-RC1]